MPELPAYEILGLLGRGGMGAVYRARQKSLNREVAIKVLPPNMDDGDMRYAERFIAEAQAMGRLEHQNIIAVYDAGQTPGGLLYFAMQYVQGTDVAQMIRASGKLPPEHAYAILAHVCEALAYAHANGIIHRDIKPANIMVDTQGRVKVADFGLAKMANEEHGFTQSNMAVGTPDFVAPEALIPGMSVDGRADIYALGVMLYQMLTGNIPRGAWHAVSVVVPGVDPRFDPIIIKAMQVDREARHSSATELRQHLDTLLMPAVSAPDLQRYSSAGMAKVAAQPPQGRAADGRAAGPPAAAASVRKPALAGASALPATAKSQAPLFIGLGIAAVIGIGAFVLFSGGKKAEPKWSAQSSVRSDETPQNSKPAQGIVRATIPAPQAKAPKQTEPPNPAPKPVAVITPPAPPMKVEPPQPAPVQPVVATTPGRAAGPPAAIAAAQTALAGASALPPALPPELAALNEQFVKLQAERVTAPYETDVTKLNSGYLGGIDKASASEKAAGHLDGILALEAEKKLITEKQAIPDTDDDKTPAALKSLRAIYRAAHAKLSATRTTNLQALTTPLDVRLKQMETDFTKADRLADAKTVRGYREALSESSHELQLVPGAPPTPNATASTTPPGSGLKPTTTLNPAAMLALKDGITNTLGMKFLPVKGTEVLFCIHETRRQDYAAYAAEAPSVNGAWKTQQRNGIPCGDKDDHPVVGVSWEDATKFCEWLSKKEGKTYRLPTDEEWSIAVGLGRKEKHGTGITPEMLNKKEQTIFPWDGDYPPRTKDRAGNYGDTAWTEKFPTESGMKDYTDGFPTTAPVMSFKPNKLGFYDMGGNVWEWVEDWWNDAKTDRVLRGASFDHYDRALLLASYRSRHTPGSRSNYYGFRVVMVVR